MDYINQATELIKKTFDPKDINALSDRELRLLVLGCSTGIENVMEKHQAVQSINTTEISESSYKAGYDNGYDVGYTDGVSYAIDKIKEKMNSLSSFRM